MQMRTGLVDQEQISPWSGWNFRFRTPQDGSNVICQSQTG